MRGILQELDPRDPLPPYRGKTCGGCTACCLVVAVAEIGLASFSRCPHVTTPPAAQVGCSIYANRPRSCRQWSCSWLIGELDDAYRPDRIGMVIDPLPDTIKIDGIEVAAAQFYALPGYEESWRDGPVRTLIEATCETMAVVFRYKQDGRLLARGFKASADRTAGVDYSQPFPADKEFSRMDVAERMRKAQELLRR